MTDKSTSVSSVGLRTQQTRPGPECLTEPQREFARLLGQLLAERWEEEQREKEANSRQDP